MSPTRIRTGIAGWTYEPWRGEFYPAGLVQKNELAHASARLGVIEINATFRGTQKPDSFRKWAAETPQDFVFSVKGPQLVTHIKRLQDVRLPLANFFASGPLALGKRLGPFVWQLPPSLKYDAAVMEDFLALLPGTAAAVADLGAGHDERLKTPPYLDTSDVGPIRHAIEVRHESFADTESIASLRRHNVALVTADTAEWPTADLTAEFAYCRLQGPAGVPGGYGEADIDAWAKTLVGWTRGNGGDRPVVSGIPAPPRPRDVFAIFVHEDKLHAPANAQALMRRVEQLSGESA